MNSELLDVLEDKVVELVRRHAELKAAHDALLEENQRLQLERVAVRERIDGLLARLDGV
jgi:cell division protein ZapB